MNAFHVCGALFAAWAVLVAFLGIRQENFPPTQAAARIVGAISVVLALLAIGTAIYTGANEEEHEEGQREEHSRTPSGEEASFVLPPL